jgi:hypothetical protein
MVNKKVMWGAVGIFVFIVAAYLVSKSITGNTVSNVTLINQNQTSSDIASLNSTNTTQAQTQTTTTTTDNSAATQTTTSDTSSSSPSTPSPTSYPDFKVNVLFSPAGIGYASWSSFPTAKKIYDNYSVYDDGSDLLNAGHMFLFLGSSSVAETINCNIEEFYNSDSHSTFTMMLNPDNNYAHGYVQIEKALEPAHITYDYVCTGASSGKTAYGSVQINPVYPIGAVTNTTTNSSG